MGEEPNLVVVAARLAYRVARLPFSWAAAAPVAAWSLLRGYKQSLGEPGQAAARAKFDTRKWTAELLKHLDWRRDGRVRQGAEGSLSRPVVPVVLPRGREAASGVFLIRGYASE